MYCIVGVGNGVWPVWDYETRSLATRDMVQVQIIIIIIIKMYLFKWHCHA